MQVIHASVLIEAIEYDSLCAEQSDVHVLSCTLHHEGIGEHAFVNWQLPQMSCLHMQIIGLCTTIGVWWLFFANDSVKSMVEDILAPVVAFLDSCWGWVQDKVSNITGRQRQDAENAYFQPLSGGEGLALDEEDARSPPLFPMR